MTGRFSSGELEQALAAHVDAVEQMRISGEWAPYADLYIEDVEYVEHAFGVMRGREAVRTWIVDTMGAFPGRLMTGFPIAWHVLDVDRDRIVCEVRNPMPDPGDGTVFDEPNISIFDYAGDGLWARQEDVYNPLRFHQMAKRWSRIAAEHGRLPEDASGYL